MEKQELVTVGADDNAHAMHLRAISDVGRAEADVFVSVDGATRIMGISRQRESARVYSCALSLLADTGVYLTPGEADVLHGACCRVCEAVRLA